MRQAPGAARHGRGRGRLGEVPREVHLRDRGLGTDREDDRCGIPLLRSSAAHICRYLGDVRIDDITADMIVSMQRRLLTEDGLCPDSVAYVEFVQVRCYESTRPRPRHSGGRKPPPPVPHAQAPLTLVGTGGYGSSEARFHACCVIVKLLSAAHTLVYSDEPGGCIRICNACTLTARASSIQSSCLTIRLSARSFEREICR